MEERIQKLITRWRERAEWAYAKMDVAIETIDKVAYESVWLESSRISDDLESLLTASLLGERQCAARGCTLCTQWVMEYDSRSARFEALGGAKKAGMTYEEMRLKGYVSPINHPSVTRTVRSTPTRNENEAPAPPREQWTHPTWEPALPPPMPPPVRCQRCGHVRGYYEDYCQCLHNVPPVKCES